MVMRKEVKGELTGFDGPSHPIPPLLIPNGPHGASQNLELIAINVISVNWDRRISGTLSLRSACWIIFIPRLCRVVRFGWWPVRNVGRFCLGFIQVQSMLFPKDLEFSFALLFDTLDASFDDSWGCSDFCDVRNLSDDRYRVLEKFEGSKQSGDCNAAECFSSYVKCCLFGCGLSSCLCSILEIICKARSWFDRQVSVL